MTLPCYYDFLLASFVFPWYFIRLLVVSFLRGFLSLELACLSDCYPFKLNSLKSIHLSSKAKLVRCESGWWIFLFYTSKELRASTFVCFFPFRWTISKSYACKYRNHLANLPVGSFMVMSHLNTEWSVIIQWSFRSFSDQELCPGR